MLHAVSALAARSPRPFLTPGAVPDDPEEEEEVTSPLCVQADALQEPISVRSDILSTGFWHMPRKTSRRPSSRSQCVKVSGGFVALFLLLLAAAVLPRLKTDPLWLGSRGGLRGVAAGDRRTVLGLELEGGCHNAVMGEECYKHLQWAMQHGVRQNPKLFPGLIPDSSIEEFQAALHRAHFGNCPFPCKAPRGLVRPGSPLLPNSSVLLHPLLPRLPQVVVPVPGISIDADLGPPLISAGTTEPETSDTPADCYDAREGETCYDSVVHAMEIGIVKEPERYKGLDTFSTFADFQACLQQKEPDSSCKEPCPPSVWQPTEAAAPASQQGWPFSNNPLGSTLNQRGRADGQAVCAKAAAVPSFDEEGPRWEVEEEENKRCFKLYSQYTNQHSSNQLGRNWCWVSYKDFGCHRTFYGQFTWADGRDKSILYMGDELIPRHFSPLRKPGMCDRRHLGTLPRWSQKDWRIAHEWFQENVRVYILSLPISTERRKRASARFHKLHIPFTFVKGVDLREKGSLRETIEEGLMPETFNISLAQAEALRNQNNMGGEGSIVGTVGCAAAHFRALDHAVRLALGRPLAVVFEDDVDPVDDFVPRLWHMVTQELPCDWQAVSLSSRCPYGECISSRLTRVRPDINEPEWRCRHGVNYGFQAVLYRVSEIKNVERPWKATVFDAKRPHCLDVDVALASISDKVRFYAVPEVQVPGFITFVTEGGSSRLSINRAAIVEAVGSA